MKCTEGCRRSPEQEAPWTEGQQGSDMGAQNEEVRMHEYGTTGGRKPECVVGNH